MDGRHSNRCSSSNAESELLDNASSSLFDAEANGLQHEAISEQDFVEIDNLLSALEQPDNDDSRFEQLNVDVGLDEFADIIGEHTKMDVDQEDNGFAAKDGPQWSHKTCDFSIDQVMVNYSFMSQFIHTW